MKPVPETMVPRLRALLDERGLGHVAIRLEPTEREFIAFEPTDPNWREYRVQGAPLGEWIHEARFRDYCDSPSVTLSDDDRWEIAFGYAQGMLPAQAFADESTFLTTLLDILVEHYRDRLFVLGVHLHPDGTSWGRIDPDDPDRRSP